MRKKLLLMLLALAASACVYLVADQVWIRGWTRWHVGRLVSNDRSEFSRSFGALAYDADARVAFLLLDELERSPPKELYYQIVRILYTRCGVHYAPEDVALPAPDALRRMVKEKYAGRDARKP